MGTSACVKEVDRSALVAFAPDAPFLAAGTMAGAVDMSFSSSANLEILSLDFRSDDRELPVSGAIPSSEPFNRLSWGKSPSSGSEEFSLGLIAGGLVDGNIGVWNPRVLMSEESENALVQQLSRHKGPVRGLEFSSLSPNHLASGAEEVVWDLRKQKPIISFSDSVRRRCSVLQWHPDFATQLIVASDDDNSPSLRLWDMRNTMTPMRELVGHTKGVVAMSWCPHDSSYLLTCAKDNRTILWDTNSAEACARYGVGEGYYGSAPLKAPKWYQRKAGVSFGFGGKLVSFHTTGSSSTHSEVDVHELVTEHSLVSTSSEFEAAMSSGERPLLRHLCDKKAQESGSEEDRETWGFLKVMFEDDGTARTKLLNHLGFTLPSETQDEKLQNNPSEDTPSHIEEPKEELIESTQKLKLPNDPSDNGEDFFNNFPSPKAETPMSTSHSNFVSEESGPVIEEVITENNNNDNDSQDALLDDGIQRALVVGDYKGAVEQCIAANKMADALVIAQVGGASLWETTRDHYFKKNTSPYLKVVAAMVNNDLASLVNIRPLKSWKETLALLCTFAQGDEWTSLCDTLASRLITAGNTLAATLCYICSGNIDKTVEIWSKKVTIEHDGKSYVDLLQDLMEKTVVLAFATGQKRFSASICKLVEKYTEILASQGLLSTAMEYLKLIPTEDLSPELIILRDRITLSSQPDKNESVSTDFAYSQTHTGAVYTPNQQTNSVYTPNQQTNSVYTPNRQTNSVVEPHQNYYQENYQQPTGPSYGNQYEHPQRNMFVPSPAAPTPPMGFNQPPAVNQPTARPFVPMTPPMMRNADQYQQAPTLGSQLYPSQVNANSNYQAGPPGPGSFAPVPSPMVPTMGPKVPHDVAPTPPVRGFMPINNNNTGMQRTGSGQMQPNTGSDSAPPPATPPPTVHTADVSNVPAHQKAVIGTLTKLFNETSEALGGSRAVPAKKREIDDNSKKLGALFVKLNNSDISKNAGEKLVQLCQALNRGDFPTALKIQVDLTTSDWDECSFWLATLKRMIRIRQSMG
ncbi:hypothetical protein L2E82_29571 [Cichorium intybus]|uniref:Uncharacterized protein n=1 Tax=Cichorium intybus TaxID=13427 RepID=A0ACB9CY02_CICIN|nr:hypothetical protein L2E82_29571 [Cichorium intybus]